MIARKPTAICGAPWMASFTLSLQDSCQHQDIAVERFTGRDASGSFVIQAGHETLVTVLSAGLCRMKVAGQWQYLAQPGAVLSMIDNRLTLSTSQYMLSEEPQALIKLFENQWQQQDDEQRSLQGSVVKMEQALARKLWEMNQRRDLF